MKNLSVFVRLNAADIKYKELEISIIYSLGGMNYFSDRKSARGIYLHLSPCSRVNGMVQSTMLGGQRESGFKVLLEELPRKSQKRIDYWVNRIEPMVSQIGELYAANENQKLIDMVKGIEPEKMPEAPYILHIDGKTEPIENLELETLQKAVGGYIEMVPARNGQTIVLDEEGKLKNKPINLYATRMFINGQSDPIVGDVVIANEGQIK